MASFCVKSPSYDSILKTSFALGGRAFVWAEAKAAVLFFIFFSIAYSFENCTNKASYLDFSISTKLLFKGTLTSPSMITIGEVACTSAILIEDLSDTMTVVLFSNDAMGVTDKISGSSRIMGP